MDDQEDLNQALEKTYKDYWKAFIEANQKLDCYDDYAIASELMQRWLDHDTFINS